MSFFIKSIDHIQLAAPQHSEEIARAFYQGLLGFEEVEKPEELRKRGGVWFSAGAVQLHIGIEDPFYPAKKAHPGLVIENIDALMAHLNEKDVEFIEDDKLPGAKRFYMNDPFGNRLEMLEWI
ncbi:MAG: VOC family protein [Bacillota bacterium]|nr:VOC family protein [Bacillota bacterium]MDP4171383.1 VOC family protein [Bacillota bacterium]